MVVVEADHAAAAAAGAGAADRRQLPTSTSRMPRLSLRSKRRISSGTARAAGGILRASVRLYCVGAIGMGGWSSLGGGVEVGR